MADADPEDGNRQTWSEITMGDWLWKSVVAIGVAAMVMAGSAMAEEKKQAPPARVVTAPLVKKSVAETVKVVGTLYFDRVSDLSAEVSSLVSSVHFTVGDHVKKGDLMIRLNTDFIDNEIETVIAGMEQVRVRLDKAEKDLVRYKTLFSQDATSESDYDEIALSREELVRQLVILEKNLDLAKLKKKKSAIYAPFDGVVLEKTAETGSWVSPGSQLCTLGALDELYVKAGVSEELLVYAGIGQSVDITINALGRHFTGTIAGIIPVADPQTKAVFVKVKVPRLKNPVLNMAAMVSLPASEKKEMFLVPRDALVSYNGKDLVYTIKDGNAAPIPITILSYVGENVAIADQGLPPGMPLVVDGNDRLRPGQPVVVINQPAQKQ